MYSRLIRTHQKIDKVAFRHLGELVGDVPVLAIANILHYEGRRGPDAPRLYKTGDAPWHYYDPLNDSGKFLVILSDHYGAVVRELKRGDTERAAFEAAWLAHALVDGLTPPHHFTIEAELEDLHKIPVAARRTVRSHLMVKGEGWRDSLTKSLRLSGPRGLLTAHTLFELGAGGVIKFSTLARARPNYDDLYDLKSERFVAIFERYAREINSFDMYGRLFKYGWTPGLARDVLRELAPRQARVVTLAWYSALVEAGLVES